MRTNLNVSIITICLNAEKTIDRTLRSVVSQLSANDEYIIIDGGSVDNTKNIIRQYESSINYYVSEKDQGISNAFNKGIKACTGDIIGIVNSDDWLKPNAVTQVKKCATDQDVDIIYSDVMFWSSMNSSFVKNSDHHKLGSLLRGSSVYHPTVFVKRNVYDTIGEFSEEYKLRMDFDFLIRAAEAGYSFYKSSKVLANYRKGGISSNLLYSALKEEVSILRKNRNDSVVYLFLFFIVRLIVLFIVKPLRESLYSLKCLS